VAFVGGHPLAGRLRSRVDEADASLFVGATYCLSPTSNTPEWGIDRATQLVEAIGAVPHFLDAEEHDGLLAAVSHLPYFAAAALIGALGQQPGWADMGPLAAGGFRTASSLVDGSPRMWTDIALTNAAPLERQLGALIAALTDLRSTIADGEEAKLGAMLDRAYAIHRQWVEAHEANEPQTTDAPSPSAPKRRFPFRR
jgi:prephenate dehydrogenase